MSQPLNFFTSNKMASPLGARTLLVAPGISISNKKLLVTSNKGHHHFQVADSVGPLAQAQAAKAATLQVWNGTPSNVIAWMTLFLFSISLHKRSKTILFVYIYTYMFTCRSSFFLPMPWKRRSHVTITMHK